jgi:Rad3-related DNA helicase
MKYKWHSYFPFQKPRQEQTQAIEFALSAFSTDKKYCVMEMPTGTGKSAVAVTLGQYFANEPFLLGFIPVNIYIIYSRILQNLILSKIGFKYEEITQ